MLVTHTLPPSHPLPPTSATRRGLLSNSRPALADSTNIRARSNAYGHSCRKYPTSSVRTGCGWDDIESPTESVPALSHSRLHHLSSAPSPFSVTCKAPPTVSISLSAACSQNIPGGQLRGFGLQGSGPDLPDVRSVVPFPRTPLDGDLDVEMADGTCRASDGHSPSDVQTPRKRRSAHSTVSPSQGSLAGGAKQKRPRKSKRQVAELWWLGVVQRSVLRAAEVRQSRSSDRLLSGPHELDTMDHALVEKIQKRLAENGCVEGRALHSPLPRISSPSMSVPSLSLLVSSRKSLPIDSDPLALSPKPKSYQKENNTLDRTPTALPIPKASPSTSLSIISNSPIVSSTTATHRRHVRFEIPQCPRQPPRSSIPRRSPSPPARTGTVPVHAQTLTLTMPQLVASLTLAYHERSRMRLRDRTCKPTEYEKNAGHSSPPGPCQVLQYNGGDATKERTRILRARLSSAPLRKSPLSRVTYAEG